MAPTKSILTNTLAHLPEDKQQELALITALIREQLDPKTLEMIILFGSYATGHWVEDTYVEDGITYEYKSDYDILVVTKSRKGYPEWGLQQLSRLIREDPRVGKASLIHHPINFLNEKISNQYYFFTDIYQEGVLLYDSKRKQLAAPQKLSPKKRLEKAEDYFAYWLEKGDSFFRHYRYATKETDYNMAAFQLHQATEGYYSALLLVFTDYRPKTHDLEELGSMVNKLDKQLRAVFPRQTAEEKHLFELLRRAYVEARYNKNYRITAEELQYLAERVQLLRALTEKLCGEEIVRLKGL